MKILINLQLKDNRLPLDYRPVLLSLIKVALSKNYPEEYEKLYLNSNQSKHYTFSLKMSHPVFENDVILLSSPEIVLDISSSDEYYALLLYNAFQKINRYTLPLQDNNGLSVVKTTIIPTKKITQNNIFVKFISPMVIRKHISGQPDKYYIYNDDEFLPTLKFIIDRQFGREINISIEPICPKKTVVLAFGTKIRSSLGTYRITSDPEVLDVISKGGIGSRRSEGFGYFQVIGG